MTPSLTPPSMLSITFKQAVKQATLLLASAGLACATGTPAQAQSGKAATLSPQAKQMRSALTEPGAKDLEELDPANFDRSENIDHPWWPLKPGMQWVYEGSTQEDGKRTPHRIVFTVTDLVKVIAGVRSRVILDADYSQGKLIEQELTYFAQDKQGNIWHLGQYRETFDDEFVGGRIWHVGNPQGAKAGIMMPADPQKGTPSFSQGYAPPPFNWSDRARVYQTGQKTKVAAGRFDDVLVIEEFDAEHPGAFQLKYYARGVGHVRVGWRGIQAYGTETMELVKAMQLDEARMAQIRAQAFELEKRASMFPALPPMEQSAALP